MRKPVIAIFDVGKTNKKLFLFDEQYKMVYEESSQFTETVDEDDFPCEDVAALTKWIKESFSHVLSLSEFEIKAVNFSAYGASFVHVDANGKVLTPLYNYLKHYPQELQNQFYNKYGGEAQLSVQTASPVLGSLTSGLQLYRIKYEQPEVFEKIQYALHLPQYLSFILSQKAATDLTSVGCHTLLWDFEKGDYHQWVREEGLLQKFASIYPGDKALQSADKNIAIGFGLHDSSAALIPYLASFPEPFVLISTGTWCISLNPFNETLLTYEELQQDCLCYLTYKGKPVKASRLFAGNEHEQQTKKLASHFDKEVGHYKLLKADSDLLTQLQSKQSLPQQNANNDAVLKQSLFGQRDLSAFSSYEEAYHQLIIDIVAQQIQSTQLVLNGSDVKRIFVDGGFSKNPIYMHLLATAFSDNEVFAASLAQATSMGAALAIHSSWNQSNLPNDIIELKNFSVRNNALSTK